MGNLPYPEFFFPASAQDGFRITANIAHGGCQRK